VTAAAADPSLLDSSYVLPPDYAIMSETAEVFTKALLLGMEPDTESNFADAEPIEIMPYEEALAYMKKRLPVDPKIYYEMADKLRFRAFTASRLTDGDAVKRVQGMLAASLEEGKGLREFLKMTESELANAAGMSKGSGWYYETVYRTNMSTAYNVGRAIGFEEVPPIALELIGIDDSRQTEVCHSLTAPPFRRPYGSAVWETLWPPFHFNCRTTVRAIYDQAEIDGAGGPDKFYSQGMPDFAPAEGFGRYPVDKCDSWWDLTDSMQSRAGEYGLEAEFMEAREKLVGPEDAPGNANSFATDEEKVAETLHNHEGRIKSLDHEECVVVGRDGKHIATRKGTKDSVKVPHEARGNITTHNHPSGGCAFSVGDIGSNIELGVYEFRAVTGDGRFVSLRLMEDKGELKRNQMLADFKRDVPSGSKLFLKADAEAMRIHGPKRTRRQAIDELENIVNKWFVDNARKYGYIFRQGRI
jgi:hypothetical protein